MYNFKEFEKKWQELWKKEKLGITEVDPTKPKFFLIWAYLTVSGFHHVGHMRGYSYTDAIARYKRMMGFNVLLTAGGHATGNGAVSKSLKVKEKDPETIDFYKSMGLNDNDLKEIETPEGFVNFFSRRYIKDYHDYGFLGDFRRFTVTTNPDYQKFIEWQFKKLKENDLLVQKPYFATFSEKSGPVAVDPSEMDLQKGGTAQKNEYTLLKLKLKDNEFVIVATLRPETVFGQTNVWIDSETTYAKIKVDNEIWIGSFEFYKKLSYQKDNIEFLEEIKGSELLGKYVTAPKANRDVIILPSKFCNPDIGSGIVTSVPSDAPIDYMGIYDLQNSKELCEKYNLDYNEIQKIKPIPIIKSKGFGDYPAIEICKQLDIKSQDDLEKLENAKKEIYKKGFHTGVLREISGKYKNMKVEKAKDLIKEELISNNLADIFYDLSEEVICRLGGKVYIKRIDDQWFIKYSDDDLTKKTISHIYDMFILPEQFKKNLSNVLNWFSDRACARQGRWLGTKLPFDKKYTIEPISDSTLYPIFYLVSLYTNSGEVKVEQLTEEFFDFVYLEKGDVLKVSENTGIKKELLEKIQLDVRYFYPLDINIGGKEHQTVHFPTFLLNHIGILPKKYYPKGIFVNWWVVGKKGKLSKSKGGVGNIKDEANKYSIDAIRLFYSNIANPFNDITFDEQDLLMYKNRLEKIYTFIENIKESDLKDLEKSNLDNWILSKFNLRLKSIIDNMEELEFKATTDEIYFNIYNDLLWYQKRGGKNKKVLEKILNDWVKTTCIFTPHLSEEINSVILENNYLVSSSNFPQVNLSEIDLTLDKQEKDIEDIISDIREVKKIAKIKDINNISLFVSKSYKYDLFLDIIKETEKSKDIGMLINKFSEKYPDVSKKELAKIIKNSFKKLDMPFKSQKQELDFFNEIKPFLEDQVESKINIINSDNSNHKKAEIAVPGKVGILVE